MASAARSKRSERRVAGDNFAVNRLVGVAAHLGERLSGRQEVRGSIPLNSIPIGSARSCPAESYFGTAKRIAVTILEPFVGGGLDTTESVWLMLHSGSRNIGKTLAEIHIGRARKLAHNAKLPDRDLAVFLAGTREMEAYRYDLFWTQSYAKSNREVMLKLYQDVIRKMFPQVRFDDAITCHHNYVAEEVHFGEDGKLTKSAPRECLWSILRLAQV